MGATPWPYGRGEMAERICTYNWAATPLGPIRSWPQTLKTAVELMLATGFPTSILWGQEAILLYNDAKARFLGDCHPAALGQSAYGAPPVIRDSLEPVIRRVRGGESVVHGEQRHVIQDKDDEREVWVDHLASPMRDETGAVAGLWMVLIDVTARVHADRQRQQAEDVLRRSEASQAFMLRLTDRLREMTDPLTILTAAARMTGEHFGVDHCCYGDIHADDIQPRACWASDASPIRHCFAFADVAVPEACQAGQALVVADVETDPRFTVEERQRIKAARIAALVCVPLRGDAALV